MKHYPKTLSGVLCWLAVIVFFHCLYEFGFSERENPSRTLLIWEVSILAALGVIVFLITKGRN